MSRPGTKTTQQIAKQVMLRIALIIGTVEVGVMWLFLAARGEALGPAASVIEAMALVLFSTPLVYFWVVRPLVLERERQLAESQYLAHHDELTKLCNRRMFYDHLEHCLPGLARQQRVGALIYVDLDGFKPVNDEYGHDMGDRVLVEIGQRLASAVRGEDVVARLGGDEFALLVAATGSAPLAARQQAEDMAQRVLRLTEEPMAFQGLVIQVGCSIGVHMLTPTTANARVAMKAADQAMYRAKQQSGSVVFSDTLSRVSYDIVKIGVAEIDREHEEIDQLLSELLSRRQGHWTGLDGFRALVAQHFDNEVAISRRLGLNMSGAHLEAHHSLLEQLQQLAAPRTHNDWVDPLMAVGALLEEHVTVHDRALRDIATDAMPLPVTSN